MDPGEVLPKSRKLEAEGKFNEAVDLLSDALQAEPSRGDLLLVRGRIRCEKLDQAAEAVDDFRAASELDPASAAPHQYSSLCFLSLGDSETAWDHACQAVDLSPDDAFSHYCYARCLTASRRLNAAATAFQTAANLDPSLPLYQHGLIGVLIELEKYEEAELAIVKLLHLDESPSLCIRLARTQLAQRKAGHAIDSLKAAASFSLSEVDQALVEGYRRLAN